MKSLFNFIQQRITLLIIIAFASTVMLLPLASNVSIPVDLDYLNHISGIIQAKLALAQGQMPLRIAPTDHEGWSYPLFQFYSPTSYMISGFIYRWITPSNPYIAFKVTLWCALFFSGVYMYKLSNWFVQFRPAAILASVVYITTPYTIILIGHIGAFNECIGISIIPAVLYYTLQQYYHPNNIKGFLLTGVAWYCLATIHLLTFLSTSFVTAIFLLFLSINNPNRWISLANIFFAYLFGCLLAMWFIGPIILLSKYLIISRTFINPAFFYAYAPTLADLLAPSTFFTPIIGHTDKLTDSISLIHPNVGLPILMAVLLSCYVFFQNKTYHHNQATKWLPSLIALFFVIFLLIWSPINFWKWLPQSFRVIQYSWRLLAHTAWIGALLFSFAICWLCHLKLNKLQTFAGIAFVILCSATGLFLHEDKLTNYNSVIDSFIPGNPYLIDATKYPQFIHLVDSILLDSVKFNNQLTFNSIKPITIPTQWIKTAVAPFILIEGTIPNNISSPSSITASIGNKTIATYELKSGPMSWNIPIHLNKKSNASITINFKINTKPNVIIPIKEISFGGILNPANIITANQIQPHCQTQNETTECNIYAQQTTQLIELPIFYYPKLLNITIDGAPTPYISIFYKNNVITGIIPHPGKTNIIKIQFRGLLWANYLSAASWQLWILLLSYLVLRKTIYKK